MNKVYEYSWVGCLIVCQMGPMLDELDSKLTFFLCVGPMLAELSYCVPGGADAGRAG